MTEQRDSIEFMKLLKSFNFDRDVIIGALLFVEEGYAVGFAITLALKENLIKKDWVKRLEAEV